MKQIRLPHYYYLPLAVISFLFTLAVVYTTWIGIGSWNLNRSINWGGGWFRNMDYRTMMYINIMLSSLPIIGVFIYFIRQFLKRKDMFLLRALLLVAFGFGASIFLSTLINN